LANELNIGVKFGAEGVPQVSKSISQLTDQLKRFQEGLKTSVGVDSIARLNKAIAETKTRIQNLQNFTGQSDGVMGGIVKGSNQAAASLTNLSRVAQDAPFGFIGIQNNLNPLIESFGRLKQETGSTGAAFKALTSSLAGPAGIGLALGVVTGLVTVAIQKYGSLGNALNALFGEYDGIARANDELAKSFSEATGRASSESAVINSLIGIARNDALSKEARQEAISKLNKEYDEFLPKLTLENINTQAVTDSVNKLNEALLRQAKIKGVQDLIAKEFEKLTLVLSDMGESVGFLDKIGAVIEGFGDPVKSGTALIEKGLKRQSEAADEARKRIEVFNKVLNELLVTEATEGTLFTETQKKGADALKARLTALEKIRDVTKDLTALADLQEQIFDLQVKITLRDAAKNGLSKEETDLVIAGFRKQLSDAFEKETLSLEGITKIKFTKVEVAEFSPEQIDALVKGTQVQLEKSKFDIAKAAGADKNIPIESDRQVLIRLKGLDFVLAQEEAKKAVDRLRETVLAGTVDAFATIGSAFGEVLAGAFSGGGIGEAFAKAAQSLLAGIGGVLQEIGKQIIATSALIQALKKALATLIVNPVAGILVGVGLIALGSLLKNIKIPAFAGGVNNFSGGVALVGERGPELVNLPKGSDVIPNHMLGGGNMNVILAPVVEFGYDRMRIGLRREEERRRRI
jgi:hypothetical protein